MNNFSKEFLFRECVLHHHCIMLHLYNSLEWDDELVDEVFVIGIFLSDDEQRQLIMNIANMVNTYGIIKIKAFADHEAPSDAREVTISTDNIVEVEFVKN